MTVSRHTARVTRKRAAALRRNQRDPPVASWSITVPVRMTCSPAPRALPGFFTSAKKFAPQGHIFTLILVVQAICGFSASIDTKVPCPYNSLSQAQPTSMTGGDLPSSVIKLRKTARTVLRVAQLESEFHRYLANTWSRSLLH